MKAKKRSVQTKKSIDLAPGQVWLGKYLAQCGVASRRMSSKLVQDGLVMIDGKTVFDPGMVIDPSNHQILVDGEEIRASKKKAYYALYKPEGILTTMSDPESGDTVGRLIEKKIPVKVFPVGRLDCNTSGLLVLTNDGDFANKLTHPSFGVSKTYLAILDRPVNRQDWAGLIAGVKLYDGFFKPDEIAEGDSRKELRVTIHSGRNRIIRRFFEAFGYQVKTLVRVKFGSLELERLKIFPGEIVKIRKEWI